MQTQSIRYTGSKKIIIPRILELIKNLHVENILDGMSGTTRVSQALKKSDYVVWCNDIAVYSKILGQCYIKNNSLSLYTEQLEHLNNMRGVVGWFSENYGGIVSDDNTKSAIQQDGKKRIWQLHNTMKLDVIRDEIDIITNNEINKSILLTSLMLALDAVDNTIGHQVSYLKQWSARSYDSLKLELPQLITSTKEHFISQKNIFEINDTFDLVYLDPPYGTSNKQTPTSRVRYASYYHLWTTICLNDKPKVVGAANRRYDASSDLLPNAVSIFENTNEDIVFEAFSNLINKLNTRYILLSYSNKSRLSYDKLLDIFSKYKIIEIQTFSYKENIMKTLVKHSHYVNNDTIDGNKEFLFLIEK